VFLHHKLTPKLAGLCSERLCGPFDSYAGSEKVLVGPADYAGFLVHLTEGKKALNLIWLELILPTSV
jgi:hypothetical protein